MDHTSFVVVLLGVISTIILSGTTNATTTTREGTTFSSLSAFASASALDGATDANKGFADAVALPTQSPSFGPDVISRVNNGVSTILGGVRNLSLEQILRGSFLFTRNENVRNVANNVLDNVFFLGQSAQQQHPQQQQQLTNKSVPAPIHLLTQDQPPNQNRMQIKQLQMELEKKDKIAEQLDERIRLLEQKNRNLREEIARTSGKIISSAEKEQ